MKILIVEDEAVAARRLERLTRATRPDQSLDFVRAHSLDTASSALASQVFDLIFLDLNLAGEDGFTLLNQELGSAPVIVVSAFPDRAIEAFGHAVLDFVPKPVNETRLAQALARALDQLRATPDDPPKHLVVRNPGRADFVDLQSIVRISGADDYCEIDLTSGKTLLHDQTLAVLEKTLPANFMRVHRSYIANLHHASALEGVDGGFELVLGTRRAPVGRRRLKDVRLRLDVGAG
jgi:two-component system response regulator LytT